MPARPLLASARPPTYNCGTSPAGIGLQRGLGGTKMTQQQNPTTFAAKLSAKLASTSRHVILLLGAGVGRACGLPDVSGLQATLLEDFSGEGKAWLERHFTARNLEGTLTRLRRIAALLEGDQTLDGMTSAAASLIDKQLCKGVIRALDVTKADTDPVRNLAAWVSRARYRSPVEIFTLNYDLLMETALEGAKVPYFDGFLGTLRARFQTDLVENKAPQDVEAIPSFFARLWKLHGSVNWERTGGEIVRLGAPVVGDAAAIYPSDAKYDESRRLPFVVLHDRLRRALLEPETLTIVAGYSFQDEHVNEVLFDAAARRERSDFVCVCYSAIPAELRKRAAIHPNLQVVTRECAILSGVEVDWATVTPVDGVVWGDEGLCLANFAGFARYLNRDIESTTNLGTS